ncbi:huntingtin interacting protein [Reticulomyxa filosa]|uniref:Huntingtin interacting protein n=1 Tax=Reticulomyxa filosa TaxID=46433 RepID=X6LUX4_RETFI|nr:huntingtin interacting protein [Reticulomyxa filosa]|eukprot:ETO04525.1 huntingtin interacting protein [Reticulomyxa filosa]
MASGEGIICDQEFAIYSKGTGVLCTRPQGISQNQFVVSFIGEVYPAWCWYEKSGRIRWLEESVNAEKQSEFFNITLERHCNDPEGYDVVFIDSSKKGNFASRISHICQPNWSMAVHSKYGIQVYSIRDIKCGEELSFDYNSVTEDEQEWKQAVCLCGMKSCRGYYLAYFGSDSYTDVLYKQYHVLHRTALFLLHTLQYIELEDKLLPLELMKLDLTNKYSLKDAEEETFGVKRTRIQNLVLTLVCFLFFNKTKFFFRNGKNARQIHIPPLQVLESELLVKKIGLKVTVSFRICGFVLFPSLPPFFFLKNNILKRCLNYVLYMML